MKKELSAHQKIYLNQKTYRISRMLSAGFVIFLIILFLPWTQNIRTTGNVTSIQQEDRPQQLNSVISGQITHWYVREGDYVKAGDTIARISEVKEDYLDPQLVQRTSEQLIAKDQSVDYYNAKSQAQRKQQSNLNEAMRLKLNQLQVKKQQQILKIESDKANLKAIQNDLSIARKQYTRQQELFEKGLVSLTQLEQRSAAFQTVEARKTSAENTLSNNQQELQNIELEMLTAQQDYQEKINKTESEIMQALSQAASGAGEVAKLKNQLSSYERRNSFYFIIAPQSGQVVQMRRNGVGEVIKEGDQIARIVPNSGPQAVELYVKPLDVPLVSPGQKIRFIFDGYPAIVFSGWPQASYGTFGGIVRSVESTVNPDGKFRVIVQADSTDKPWPKELRMGAGAQAIALLKNVPIWYELWRNINGFPPDFYKPSEIQESSK